MEKRSEMFRLHCDCACDKKNKRRKKEKRSEMFCLHCVCPCDQKTRGGRRKKEVKCYAVIVAVIVVCCVFQNSCMEIRKLKEMEYEILTSSIRGWEGEVSCEAAVSSVIHSFLCWFACVCLVRSVCTASCVSVRQGSCRSFCNFLRFGPML